MKHMFNVDWMVSASVHMYGDKRVYPAPYLSRFVRTRGYFIIIESFKFCFVYISLKSDTARCLSPDTCLVREKGCYNCTVLLNVFLLFRANISLLLALNSVI